jgi:hypothetical protein
MRRYALVVTLVLAVALAGALAVYAAEKGEQAAKGAKRPEGPPPKPLVVQFKHIPAHSFMETLKQLGRHPAVGEILQKVPMAVNQEANAVVILGPPEVTDYLAAIAKGLDQPNAFRAAQEERERADMAFHLKMGEARGKILGVPPSPPPSAMQPPMRAPGPGMQPPMGLGPGRGPAMGAPMGPPERGPGIQPPMRAPGPGMQPPMGPGPGRGPAMGAPMGPPERGAGMQPLMGPLPERGPGMRLPQGGPGRMGVGGSGRVGMGGAGGMGMQGPMRQLRVLWRLTSPEAREVLGLSADQADKIRKILEEASPE